jgi:hypothetical protein
MYKNFLFQEVKLCRIVCFSVNQFTQRDVTHRKWTPPWDISIYAYVFQVVSFPTYFLTTTVARISPWILHVPSISYPFIPSPINLRLTSSTCLSYPLFVSFMPKRLSVCFVLSQSPSHSTFSLHNACSWGRVYKQTKKQICHMTTENISRLDSVLPHDRLGCL